MEDSKEEKYSPIRGEVQELLSNIGSLKYLDLFIEQGTTIYIISHILNRLNN